MTEDMTLLLYDEERSIEFYEDRYEKGYMQEWSVEKKREILELIKELPLPDKGEALDFGCGNGILTDIIRQALPSWKIYGTDLSKNAVANAKANYPKCTFFEADNPNIENRQFDFIFTNHVFEHVYNLNEVFNRMTEYLKPESSMLHILPCGNRGSFEHKLCLLHKDGINTGIGNRFFYEDEGHVRRLTTDGFSQLCRGKEFELEKEFYSNHYYGAINWITSSHPRYALMLSDPAQAIDEIAMQKLKKLRINLVSISILRLPAKIIFNMLHKPKKRFIDHVLLILALPFYFFSNPVDRYWKRKAREEWENRKYERNGSEMALYFRRHQ